MSHPYSILGINMLVMTDGRTRDWKLLGRPKKQMAQFLLSPICCSCRCDTSDRTETAKSTSSLFCRIASKGQVIRRTKRGIRLMPIMTYSCRSCGNILSATVCIKKEGGRNTSRRRLFLFPHGRFVFPTSNKEKNERKIITRTLCY